MSATPAHAACRIAIVGASSLRGRELKLLVEDRNFPATDFVLLDESMAVGTLTEAGGEPTFIRAVDEESFEHSRFAFFAGTREHAAGNWKIAQRAGATVIDLSGALTDVPGAAVWIPALKKILPPPEAGARSSGLFSSPGPAVLLACTLSAALRGLAPQRVVIVFFPPVSERDQAGVEELENQTTNLLSFRATEQPVFDAQVAFNLLTGYGPGGRPNLPEIRAGISREVGRYLSGRVVAPAIQLVQAPVFYGYAFAAFAEFAAPHSSEEIEAGLAAAGVKLSAAVDASPTNVSVSGENEITLARVERDPNCETGYWFWGVADNLRLAVMNAVRIAEELLAC